jgi:LPS-assembly lipoprotein
MSLFRRRILGGIALIGFIAISGCGFAPLASAPTSKTEADLRVASLAISTSSQQFAFDLRKYLSQRVMIDANARDSIQISIAITGSNLAVQQNDTITRRNLTAKAQYKLTDSVTDNAFSGDISSTTAINTTTDFFATRASERAAQQLLAKDVGRKVVTILYARKSVTE